ncbi:hypothetical protein LCGC14_2237040 [marine sediment metagenome]|uniref:Uncharacterized protein n=1 Tax=marine sediment metagenome TaxID=412755 RepID=A0A0F9FJ41_9ZZZZ
MKEGIVSTEDTVKVVGVEKPEETQETTGVIDSTLGEETEQTEQTEAGSEQTAATIDWAKHNLPQFVDKDPEYVANYIKFQNRKYGEQANELGELRKGKEEYEKLKTQITGREAPEKKTVNELSDVELAMFAEEFNRNPYAAIDKYYLPKITESLTKTIFGKVEEQFGPVLEQHATSLADKQEFSAFAKEHPDWHKYQDAMKGLMTDKYIGEEVAFEEAYKLAKLQAEKPSLFESTCSLMQKGMPFDESKEYASYKQSAAANAEAKVEQVKSEVNAAAGGLKTTTAKSATSEPVIETMDDAFA